MAKKNNQQRILNCVPSSGIEQDWTFLSAVEANLASAASIPPSSVDLRENSWWAINDQRDTGSCVGWALADGLLRWHLVKKKRIEKEDLLSVRFIWMSAKETDAFDSAPTTFIEEAGTSLKSALDIARNYGCVNETVLPFDGCQFFKGRQIDFYALASRLKISAYFNLIKDNHDVIAVWKQWLADGKGPILARLVVDDTWMNAKDTNGNLDAYDTVSARGGHAVCIVGYTKDRIIIRNSWGKTDWGKDGFAFASYDYVRAAFTEAYGVVVQ